MLKIALFCDTPKTLGGIVSHCNALKVLLEKSGEYSVSVFSTLPYRNCFGIFKVYDKRAIKNALCSDDFDIIHIHGFISTIPEAVISCMKALKMKIPVVYTPHAHPFYTLNHPLRNKLFFHLRVKQVLKIADTVISINKEDFTFFKKYNNSVVTIPHWSENFTESGTEKQTSRKPKILFVGRNNENKNLKALYDLPRDNYEVICVTNTKPEREDFIFKCRISDDELSSLYKQSALTVVPSRYEAFSYVALDSLSAGTPVLLSDRVRIADFLQGVSGVTVYEYDKPEELIKKMDEAMCAAVDIKKIKQIFSAETAFASYSAIYKNILNVHTHLDDF